MNKMKRAVPALCAALLLSSIAVTAMGTAPTLTLTGGIDSGLPAATWSGDLYAAGPVPVVIHFDDQPLTITANTDATSFYWAWDISNDARGDAGAIFAGPEGESKQPGIIPASALDADSKASKWYTYFLTYEATTGSETTTKNLEVRILPASLRPAAQVAGTDGSSLSYPFTLDASGSTFPTGFNGRYEWFLDGAFQQNSDVYVPHTGGLSHGDTLGLSFRAVVEDATHGKIPSATIPLSLSLDLSPVFTASVGPDAAVAGDDITVTTDVTYPAAGEYTTNYVWLKDGTYLGADATLTLPSGVAKGDDIKVQVALHNTNAGATRTLEVNYAVGNTAPVIGDITFAPTSPTGSDDIVATAQVSDIDGDTPTLSYAWARLTDGNWAPLTAGNVQTLPASVTGGGQQYRVTVTADDGDGGVTQKTSDPVTVINAAPTLAPTVNPTAPTSADPLVASTGAADADGDVLTTSYQWQKKVNGAFVDIAGQTGATLPASATTRGDIMRVVVTVTDGTDTVTAESGEVTILNAKPVATVAITPSSATEPRAGQALKATFSAVDADDDAVTCVVQWFKNGVASGSAKTVTGCKQSKTETLGVTTAAGEIWSFQVTPSDDTVGNMKSAQVTVLAANAAPVISSVTFSKASPTTSDNIDAIVVWTDADEDDIIEITYQWQKAVSGTFSDVGGQTGAELPLSATSRGDIWRVIATVDDGFNQVSKTSASVTIVNAKPTLEATFPSTGTAGVDMTVSAKVKDTDGDDMSCTLTWTGPGDLNGTETQDCSGTQTFDVDPVVPGVWTLKVAVTDGIDTTEDEATVTIVEAQESLTTNKANTPGLPVVWLLAAIGAIVIVLRRR